MAPPSTPFFAAYLARTVEPLGRIAAGQCETAEGDFKLIFAIAVIHMENTIAVPGGEGVVGAVTGVDREQGLPRTRDGQRVNDRRQLAIDVDRLLGIEQGTESDGIGTWVVVGRLNGFAQADVRIGEIKLVCDGRDDQ